VNQDEALDLSKDAAGDLLDNQDKAFEAGEDRLQDTEN